MLGAVFEVRRYSCRRMSPLLFGRRPSTALFFDRTPCCVLCLRSDTTLVTGCYPCYLEGGLRPPYFSIGLLVGCYVRGHTLLLSSVEHSLLGAVFEVDATLVVGCYRCYLEGGRVWVRLGVSRVCRRHVAGVSRCVPGVPGCLAAASQAYLGESQVCLGASGCVAGRPGARRRRPASSGRRQPDRV